MSKSERNLPKRRAVMVVYDGVQVVDVAGTAQALTTANEEGAAPPYELRVCALGRSGRGPRHDRVRLRDCCGTPAKLEGHRHTVHSGRTRRPSLAFAQGCHLSAVAPVPACP